MKRETVPTVSFAAIDMKTVFLPWRSEFGAMILRVVRVIHRHPATQKIICTRRGLEALFPSATSFVYDWQDVPDVQKNTRLSRNHEHRRYMDGLQAKLRELHPDAEFITPTAHLINDPAWNFTPVPRVTRGLQADIMIGPRFREYAPDRNYQHWQVLIDEFVRIGLTVAAVGAKETSIGNLTGLRYKSWDYDMLDAGIELLRNCKLAVATDSGPAHLAVLCGAPVKVIHEKPGKPVSGRGNWYMDEMKHLATAHCEPVLYGWNNPTNVVREVVSYLDSAAHRPQYSEQHLKETSNS